MSLEPKVPEGPTALRDENDTPEVPEVELPESEESPEETPADKKNAKKGGRPANAELMAENKALRERIALLVVAARVLAEVPIDAAKEDTAVEYTLSRQGRTVQIHAGDVRSARRALGFPL